MKKWTTKDIETIFNMRKWNRNFQYIANYFNVTANAVRKALQRRHINYRRRKTSIINNPIHHILLYSQNLCLTSVISENNLRILNIFTILLVF